jgi:FMN phosphatase YigB (HAD superfamily)
MPSTIRVGAVGLDAMNTLLEPNGSRAEFEAEILRDIAGITVDPEELYARITELKRQHPRGNRDMSQYWPPLNQEVLKDLGATGDLPALAREWHERHYRDAARYRVRDDMRQLLERASAAGIRLAVVSNQRQRLLLELLRHHDLLRYFENGERGNRVYTSERIGYSKPSRLYIGRVAERLKLESARELAIIGNSLENDAQAAKHGVRVAILDRSGKLSEVPITLPGVTPVNSPDAAWEWIQRVCGLVEEPEPPEPDPDALATSGAGGGDGVPAPEPPPEPVGSPPPEEAAHEDEGVATAATAAGSDPTTNSSNH